MCAAPCISIHSLRMEGDRSGKLSNSQIHISIHSLRMEGDIYRMLRIQNKIISIHSLRMEGDIYRMLRIQNKIISIHSLRMEGDPDTTTEVQTTEYFNPLPPHGGRQTNHYSETLTSPFQSTPSAWRETSSDWMSRRRPDISIHSLRMEGDVVSVAVSGKPLYFNPLPPHGGRQKTSRHPARESHFNPLPPHGGRRQVLAAVCLFQDIVMRVGFGYSAFISIHSLRMEGD